jgi:hypothetical protein
MDDDDLSNQNSSNHRFLHQQQQQESSATLPARAPSSRSVCSKLNAACPRASTLLRLGLYCPPPPRRTVDECGTFRGTVMMAVNMPLCCFVHHISHGLRSNPGRREGKPVANRLSYGAVLTWGYAVA